MSKQNDLEYLKDKLEQGRISTDEANILKVEMSRVLLVTRPLPSAVRNALMSAVKSGRLEHKKKDGYKPEVFYKAGFVGMANEHRYRCERVVLEMSYCVCV